jgi:thiol-disulfide isomerase/thioredoxin
VAEKAESNEQGPEPLGFLARLGAILVRPRAALVNARRDRVAGKPGTDAALLIALAFVVSRPGLVVSGLWTSVGGDVVGGLMTIVNALAHFALRGIVVLGIAGAVVYAGAGSARKLGRDFDLGSVAFVPVMLMVVVASLLEHITGPLSPGAHQIVEILGYVWAAGLTVLAVVVTRATSAPPVASNSMRFSGGLVLALTALSLGLSAAAIIRNPARVRPVVSGDQAPSFRLPTIDGAGTLSEPFDLEATRGKVVVLDFWATWCGPCREAMPVVQDIHTRFRERGVVVLSINTEGPELARAARRLVDQLGVDTIQLSDDGRVANRFKVTTIPHMVVIDRNGVVRDVHRGFTTASRLRNRLQSVVEDLL